MTHKHKNCGSRQACQPFNFRKNPLPNNKSFNFNVSLTSFSIYHPDRKRGIAIARLPVRICRIHIVLCDKDLDELFGCLFDRIPNFGYYITYILIGHIRSRRQTHADFEQRFRNAVHIGRIVLIDGLSVHRLPQRTRLHPCRI